MAEIAVLLATYNGGAYLKEQLDSLLKQTFQDFVCYIHDDGSGDNTVSVLKQFAEAYPEKFVLLSHPPTGGAAANFIYMLSQGYQEAYIMFSDQDDVWLPDKIEKTYQTMKKQEQAGKPLAVFTDLRVVNAELEEISPSYYQIENRNPHLDKLEQLLKKNIAAGCTMMLNQPLALLCNQHSELMKLTLHDWGAILLARLYGDIIFLEEPTILYRQHGNNSVGAKKKSGMQFVLSQAGDLLSGRKFGYVRDSIRLEQALVREIHSFLEPENAYYAYIQNFCQAIENPQKLKRMQYYLNNNLISKSPAKIWMVLFV